MKSRIKPHLAVKFEETFGVPVTDYIDVLGGFDIIDFNEEFVKPPDDVSLAQAVEEKYGVEAVELIRELIKW